MTGVPQSDSWCPHLSLGYMLAWRGCGPPGQRAYRQAPLDSEMPPCHFFHSREGEPSAGAGALCCFESRAGEARSSSETMGMEQLPRNRGGSSPSRLLSLDWILAQFGEARKRAQVTYRQFVAEGRAVCGEAAPGSAVSIKGDKEERNRRIHEAVRQHGYTQSQVGEVVGLHYSTVSRIVKEVEQGSWTSRFKL